MRSTHNGEAHDECPEASPRMGLRGSPNTLLMFTLFSIESIMHKISVLQDFLMVEVGMTELLLWLENWFGHVDSCPAIASAKIVIESQEIWRRLR
jgi:hypothetical protein